MFFNSIGAIQTQVKKYINAIANGNFNGTTGWSPTSSTISASNGILTNTGSGTGATPRNQRDSNIDCVSGKKVYVHAIVSVNNSVCSKLQIVVYGSTTVGTAQEANQNTPESGQLYTISRILTIPPNAAGKVRMYLSHLYADAATANGKQATMQKAIIYDLSGNGLDSHDEAWCLANIVPNIVW